MIDLRWTIYFELFYCLSYSIYVDDFTQVKFTEA